jgi:hypothetical protein
MEEQAVRDHAQGHLDALIAGDIDRAIEDFTEELRRNLGEIMAMLPLPLTSAEVESVDRAGSGFTSVLHLVGETTETRLETRWKDRDGRPTIVEASHLSQAAIENANPTADEGETDEAG